MSCRSSSKVCINSERTSSRYVFIARNRSVLVGWMLNEPPDVEAALGGAAEDSCLPGEAPFSEAVRSLGAAVPFWAGCGPAMTLAARLLSSVR